MNRSFYIACLIGLSAASFAGSDWAMLSRYQNSITASTFNHLLNGVFSPDGGMLPHLRYDDQSVSVYSSIAQTGTPLLQLRFAEEDAPAPPRKKLVGLHVALDPGHIGGAWARMEERFFLVDRQRDWPVQEAALNLYVARLIRDRLAAVGATVSLVKNDFEPMSKPGPDERLKIAGTPGPPDPRFSHLPDLFVLSSQLDAQRKLVEREFFRTAEITARAGLVNNTIRPDLTLCIHFNATGYGDEKTLYEENGLAFFVHGNYLANELIDDEQKFFLLKKMLERSHETEAGLANAVASAFIQATQLPPAYRVASGGPMHPLGSNAYVYARNLAANRQYDGPVLFLEPYFMNNRDVYARIQAGDYDGEREINGRRYRSLFKEYAEAVVAGVVNYFRTP